MVSTVATRTLKAPPGLPLDVPAGRRILHVDVGRTSLRAVRPIAMEVRR